MRSLLFAALIAVAGCRGDAPTAAKTDTDAAVPAPVTRFTKTPPAVGSKRLETSDLVMQMTMTVDGQKKETRIAESVRHTDEVLAATSEGVSKVRVTFDEIKSTQQASALAGKTYVVEAKNGKIEARDAGGAVASADETREIERLFKNLGKPDPMLAALPANGVVPGQKVDAIANAITEQLRDSGDAMTVKDIVVTFREARGDDAIFDVSLTLSKNEGTMTMRVALKGEAWVSTKTGASTKTKLSGPVTLGGGQSVKADGSGTMTLSTETKAL